MTRHKGVHESHFYTLEQVENIANSIIASYFLVSFFLVSKREIKQNFLDKLEVRNLSYLLKSKTVSYPSTGSLLTQKEHIKLYKYRTEIEIDDDLLKFLFINYLAGNGPIFFWIKDTEKRKLISWAKEFLKSPNEDIQRNAIRFLILLGKQFPLSYLAKLFLEYELKEECVTYIEKFGTRKDIDLFITLGRKKKLEEVRYAAKEVCVKFLTMRHIKKLEKMAYSTNLDNRLLFEKVVLKNAVEESFKKYRADIINKDIYKRLVAIYSLGIVGDSNDLKNFKSEFKKKRLNRYLKEAYLKSIIRLLVKFEEMDSVTKFINRRDHFISETAILALPEDFINNHLTDLLKIYNKHPYEISNRVYEFTKKEFIKPIEEILAQAVLDNRVRYLVLSLCKVGDYNVFEFLIKLFIDYMDEIDFWNPVYIARSMSRIVSDKNKKILRKIISSDEFWKYYGEKRSKNKRMPVKDYRNVYFIKRLVGIIYPIVADYIDLSLLKKMLLHEYKMTAISVAKRIGVLAKEKDLNSIIDTTLKQDNDYILSNFVICLREIDKNIYKLKDK